MNISDVVSISKDLITLLAFIIGGLAGLFIFFQLAPVLTLSISPRWSDESQQFLLVRYEIQNKSRVRVLKPTGRLQIFEHSLQEGGSLSNYIPFTLKDYEEKAYGKTMSENPPPWHEPSSILITTRQIYPGETIVIERLYPRTKSNVVFHIGLQVKMQFGLWGRIVNRKWEPWGQTTSCMIVGSHVKE